MVFRPVRAERVGIHDICSGGKVGVVDGADVSGSCRVPCFGNFSRLEAFRLQLCAHSSVEKNDSLARERGQI